MIRIDKSTGQIRVNPLDYFSFFFFFAQFIGPFSNYCT